MTTLDIPHQTFKTLEECIGRAINKINAKKAVDLCFYIPHKNGRLHHFTFGKLKKTEPEELQKLIEQHILQKEQPQLISSQYTPRVRDTTKRSIAVTFKRGHVNRLVELLKKSGDEELLAMLAPHQTFTQVHKQMLDMIRAKEIDHDLWDTYTRLVAKEQALTK